MINDYRQIRDSEADSESEREKIKFIEKLHTPHTATSCSLFTIFIVHDNIIHYSCVEIVDIIMYILHYNITYVCAYLEC